MFYLIVGILGILMGFFGVVCNLYILLVILFSKKTRSISEWILLHLSSCGIGASILILCFSSPSIILGKWISRVEPLCDIVGGSILTLQLLTVWSICALSVDRCSAIVSPLRYTQVVTRRRVAAFFIVIWCLSITMVIIAFSMSAAYENHLKPDPNEWYFKLNSQQNPSTSPTPTTSSNNFFESNNMYNFRALNYRRIYEDFDDGDLQPTTTDTAINNHIRHGGERLDLYFANERLVIKNMTKIYHNNNNNNNNGDEMTVPEFHDSLINGESSTLLYSSEEISHSTNTSTRYRSSLGFCLPNISYMSWVSFLWIGEWTICIFVAPLCTLLICDLTVLSIAKKQRHRIVMALYQITLSAQATVTRTKGTTPPSLWMTNRAVPAKSRACRAVWEDVATIIFLNLPLIIILAVESLFLDTVVPMTLTFMGSISFFLTPSFTSLLHGVRARPLRTAYKSYLRKRLTNSTLQHEIEQRLSPVDGSPRASSRAKSFRSSTPSPNSSPYQTPHRRSSVNDLRPPTAQFSLTLSPSHYTLAAADGGRNHTDNNCSLKPRKVRSFLHIPSQQDMQEFWSGLTKSNRSPTIIITHEIRSKRSCSSLNSSSRSSTPPRNAEHLV